MKRIIPLLMAAVMVLGAASLAGAAVEFKASGHMHQLLGVQDNGLDAGFNKDAAEDNFYAGYRFRPKLTMQAEGVTAVFEAQNQGLWGSNFPVNASNNMTISLRQAYIDFKLPGTPVNLKVGYQQLNLPSIWGHPVFEGRVGGVVASLPLNEQIALTAFWARPYDKIGAEANTSPTATTTLPVDPQYNSIDMFGVLLPLNFGSVKATPYLVYARSFDYTLDNDETPGVAIDEIASSALIVGGANLEIMPTDALSIKADAILTLTSSNLDGVDSELGFMLAAAVDYELPWGTPGAFLWYATGPDKDGENQLISVATDGFCPTTWGFEGYSTFMLGGQIGTSGSSTAGIGAQIADLSFVDGLKHTVRLAYIMGTGDDGEAGEWEAWTTKDSFIEANLDSTWSIYENLSAVLELGAFAPSLGSKTKAAGFEEDLVARAQLNLRFSF